ncbi:MAG: AAA family ATPase, partial [Burkholderiales bacterium]
MSEEPVTGTSVRTWLEGLSLAQYADTFEQNAVDFDLLPTLTEKELDQLGIRVLGHRLKLIKEIEALATSPQARTQGKAAPSGPAAGPERRQLTVMFCDLVGSTTLSQKLDPEDLRRLMQRYQQVCGEAVARYGGHVAQYLGDGLVVYFGWPRAHEDDAHRGLRAGLKIIEAVKSIPAIEPLRVRIGVATGPVVVGETGGGDASVPKAAVGETPNVAARVQGLAEPDSMVISASTRRLVAEAFEYQDLGEHTLKGIAGPVRAWRVLGESGTGDRFADAHGARLTPLVNRDEDMALLLDRWSRCCRGDGLAVMLAGEPGIGKSRITAELCERVGAANVLFRAQCSEHYRNSAFYPIIALLQRAARFERSDPPAMKVDKLEQLLMRIGAPVERAAPFFAALLSLPLDRYPPLRSSPQKQKRDIIDAIVATVVAASHRQPVLLLFEDLHWMDPTTLEVVDSIVAAIRGAPMLLVMTARSEFERRWPSHGQVTVRTLCGLSRSHCLQLVGAVVGREALPVRVLERIVDRTDGVPLFLEEVTRTILESEPLKGKAGAETPTARLDEIEIPATLKDSLTARLDQLGPAKRVAQIGAVIGRQFRHDIVAALSGMPDAALAAHLRQLVASGLTTQRGEAPDALYTFHHALIQDAAYETLLKSERRELHARAGDILSERFPEMTESEPEALARHYTAGEAYDKAVPLWLKAGQKAWLRSAAPEAIAHLSAGLALIDRLPDAASRESLELRLQSALGVVYFAAVSYAAPEAQSAFLRAYDLCQRVPDVALKVPVLYGIGAFQTMKGDMRAGHDAFEKLLAEANASGQPRLRLYSHSVLAWSNFNRACYSESPVHAKEVSSLYAAGAIAGPRLSAADPKIISECFRAASLWSLGHLDQAREASEGVLDHARALGDPYSLAYTLNFAALLVPELCGEHERVLERAEDGIRLAHELGYPFM